MSKLPRYRKVINEHSDVPERWVLREGVESDLKMYSRTLADMSKDLKKAMGMEPAKAAEALSDLVNDCNELLNELDGLQDDLRDELEDLGY